MTDKASPYEYLLGAVGWQRSANAVTGQSTTTSETINTYDWYDGAVQKTIKYDGNIYSSAVPAYTTTFTNNALGQLTKAHIADGKPHTAPLLDVGCVTCVRLIVTLGRCKNVAPAASTVSRRKFRMR